MWELGSQNKGLIAELDTQGIANVDGRLGTALRNTLLLHALEDVLARLAAEGIEVVVLKGAALALTVYQNVGLRPMCDVDLLVRPAQVPAALGVMKEMGYAADGAETRPGDMLAHECEVALTKPGEMGGTIEVHWSLFDSPHYQRVLPMEWFWGTARPIQVREQTTLMLGPEAQILHLCGHLWLHHNGDVDGYGPWLKDIALCLEHDRDCIDWEALFAQAQQCDLIIPLQRTLPRVAEEYGAPAPAEVLARLASLRPSAAEERVFAWLTAGERPVAQRFWVDLATTEGWGNRAQFAIGNLFPSGEYMRQRYGIEERALVPLYYPYRWWLGVRSVMGGEESG